MANINLVGKLEGEIKLSCDVDDFIHSFGGKAHKVPDLINHKINNVEVHEHEADWKTSIKNWTYVLDGKVENFKERHIIDEETKTVTLEAIEGDCMKHYKKYLITIQIISKDGSNIAKYTIDYEKHNENERTPTHYMEWLLHMGKDLDASLVKA